MTDPSDMTDPSGTTEHREPAILFSVEHGLAHITFNRPERLNAIDAEAAAQWGDIGRAVAERDDITAVLLDARGRSFCAGGDVASIVQADGDLVQGFAETINAGHLALRESPKPIVAAVRGTVVGGGLGFMLVADYIVASENAVFASKYADIGLTPDCGVTALLPEVIGMRRALHLALSDRVLTAPEALDWGLVTEVVADAELESRAQAVAERWLTGATAAFGQARRMLRASTGRVYGDSLADEARTIGAAAGTSEAKSRMATFLAPRPRS
jgi:2-(1,2-epoxy-1,2-dihydrophenyl)acetyl-CoA isomerase